VRFSWHRWNKINTERWSIKTSNGETKKKIITNLFSSIWAGEKDDRFFHLFVCHPAQKRVCFAWLFDKQNSLHTRHRRPSVAFAIFRLEMSRLDDFVDLFHWHCRSVDHTRERSSTDDKFELHLGIDGFSVGCCRFPWSCSRLCDILLFVLLVSLRFGGGISQLPKDDDND
jgi:hypothetical protein